MQCGSSSLRDKAKQRELNKEEKAMMLEIGINTFWKLGSTGGELLWMPLEVLVETPMETADAG